MSPVMSYAATVGVLVLTLALLTVTAAYFLLRYRAYRNLDFVALHQRLTLTIEDTAGDHAQLLKEVTLVAKKDNLDHFEHRDWSADGTFKDFKIDGEPATFKVAAGTIIIHKPFDPPLRRRDRRTTTVSAAVDESFKSTREWLTIGPTYPIKHLEVEVVLPKTRPAASTVALTRTGSETATADEQPELTDAGTRIKWSVRDVVDLTTQYQIEWEWPRT